MLERKIMIKMQHNRLYKKTNKCFDDILWMYKQVSTKYTKLNSSEIVLSASKLSWFIINLFYYNWTILEII